MSPIETAPRPTSFTAQHLATLDMPFGAASDTPRPNAKDGRLARWLGVLLNMLGVLLAVGVLTAAVSALRSIVASGDWMYSDGALLYFVMQISAGTSPYGDYAVSPYMASPYWPLYLAAAGALTRLFSLGAEGALYLMRGLTVASTVMTAAAIARLVALGGGRRVAGVGAAGLFLISYVVHPWAYAARPDLPGLGLVLVGLAVLLGSRGVTGALVAGLLMAAGFACKQTFVVGIALASLTLLWRREWLRLIALVGAWVAFVFGTLVATELWSGGMFLADTVSNNLLPFRLQTMLDHVTVYLQLSLPILALAALGWRGTGRPSSARGPLTLYLLMAAAVGLTTIARAGSYYNHLIETTAILSVFAGFGLERCLTALDGFKAGRPVTRQLSRSAVLSVAALGVAVMCSGVPLLALGFKALNPPDRDALIAALREAPGPVLTEKDALAVMLAGKEPIAGDPLGAGLLAAQGRWDPTELNEMIRNGGFAMIAVDHRIDERAAFDEFQWWPAGTREAMQARYRLDRRLEDLYLYVPDPASASQESPRAAR